jgi:Flp pilus assembly pilin Flp
MTDLFRTFLWHDEGQDISEYAVMLAVILVLAVGTIRLIGSNANNVFSNAAVRFSNVSDPSRVSCSSGWRTIVPKLGDARHCDTCPSLEMVLVLRESRMAPWNRRSRHERSHKSMRITGIVRC